MSDKQWVVAIVFAASILFFSFCGSGGEQNVATENETPREEIEEVDEYLERLVAEELRGETTQGTDKLMSSSKSEDKEKLAISLRKDQGVGKDGMHDDAVKIVSNYYSERGKANKLMLTFWGDFITDSGHEIEARVLKVTFTKDNAEYINWDNIYFENIPSIADEYEIIN